MIKIIQFSREACPPCRLARITILPIEGIDYQYVNVDVREDFTEEQINIFKMAKERSMKRLPIIAKIVNNEITFYTESMNPRLLKEFVYGE